MLVTLWIVLTYPISLFRRRQDLALEVLALRHQLMVPEGRHTGPGSAGPTDIFSFSL